eukprot:scaffold228033_cov23-Cyclotella_meneghiniana.AAC.1
MANAIIVVRFDGIVIRHGVTMMDSIAAAVYGAAVLHGCIGVFWVCFVAVLGVHSFIHSPAPTTLT